jgi:hypothetical protein
MPATVMCWKSGAEPSVSTTKLLARAQADRCRYDPAHRGAAIQAAIPRSVATLRVCTTRSTTVCANTLLFSDKLFARMTATQAGADLAGPAFSQTQSLEFYYPLPHNAGLRITPDGAAMKNAPSSNHLLPKRT